MSTRDPFLTSFGIVLDRTMVWVVLTSVTFMVLWTAVWERGMGLPWSMAMRQLGMVFTAQAEPVTRTLFALTIAVAALSTGGMCVWLFARWRRQGELRGTHLRGPRLEG